MQKYLSRIGLVCGSIAIASAAMAAALPAPFGPATAGAGVNYRYKGNLDSPQGPKGFDETIAVNRDTDGTLNVLQGTTLLGSVTPAGAAVAAPKTAALGYFTGFRDIADIVKSRPADVASGAAWKATLQIPWGSQTLTVPLDVTATVDGDNVKLTAHGTLATTVPPPAHVAESDVAVTSDDSVEYAKGQLTSATIFNQETLKMELSGHQGVREDNYSARYDITPASP
jgi:hypothetical protein